jgi:transposase
LAGPERRRRWSAEEKARIVAESLAANAVASVVARRHGIHPNQLYAWRREWRLARAAAPSASAFVPVAVTAASVGMAPPSGVGGSPSGQIEIVIGMATVRVPPSADEATVHRVLEAVRRLA